MEIYLDMYQTITVAVLVLMLGKILKKKFAKKEKIENTENNKEKTNIK